MGEEERPRPPPLDYQGLLGHFGVKENTPQEKRLNIGFECENNCDNFSFTGNQNDNSITSKSVAALQNKHRYFQVIGREEDHMRNPYIGIEIKEKETNRSLGRFGLTQRMENFKFNIYTPDERHAQGGNKRRRRTKKLKKSKRRRSFK